jgi:hypothetical protein
MQFCDIIDRKHFKNSFESVDFEEGALGGNASEYTF